MRMLVFSNAFFRAAVFCASASFLFSCSSSPEKQEMLVCPDPSVMTKNFKKIKDAKVSLEVVSPEREFFAGSDAVITFRLKNLSDKQLVVLDWHPLDESANISVLRHDYEKGLKRFDRKAWAVETVAIKKERYNPLQLAPGGSVLVDKKLDFISKMDPAQFPGARGEYYVLGELNLKTLDARSSPVKIKVK